MTVEEAFAKAEEHLDRCDYLCETSTKPGIVKINANKAEWLRVLLYHARQNQQTHPKRLTIEELMEGDDPNRLTVEELMERDDPVWVSCMTLEGTDGYWCLCNKGVIICPSGLSFDVRDIPDWAFFGRRVELCSK